MQKKARLADGPKYKQEWNSISNYSTTQSKTINFNVKYI